MAALPPMPGTHERGGWTFEADTRPLWTSDRIDDLTKERKLCKVPDMYCGDAALRFLHEESGVLVELSADDALRCCSWAGEGPGPLQPRRQQLREAEGAGPALGAVQCQFAGKWQPQHSNPDVKELDVTSDWTCFSPYWGSLYQTDTSGSSADKVLIQDAEEATDEVLPMDLLRQHDEIHWYQEVVFWEDELEDNGACRLSARVRVMPTFWFALLLCEMRVDNVLFREVATRLFCRFGSDHVLREWTWKEATYEALRGRGIATGFENPQISHESIGTSLMGPRDVRQQLRHVVRLRAHEFPAALVSTVAQEAETAEDGGVPDAAEPEGAADAEAGTAPTS